MGRRLEVCTVTAFSLFGMKGSNLHHDYSWDVNANTWFERADGQYTFDGVTFHDIPDMSRTRYD